MRPEDILERDFLVGLRGYDKDEVRAFLAEIADEHAALLAELSTARAASPRPAAAPEPDGDEFENLGSSVAAILRAAKDSAAETSTEAQAKATEIREAADRYADSMRHKADELRTAAETVLNDAKAEAERIITAATDRVRQIEIESEARMANKQADVDQHEAATRARLREAAEEVQLALLALGDDGAAPEAVVDVREAEPAREATPGWVG